MNTTILPFVALTNRSVTVIEPATEPSSNDYLVGPDLTIYYTYTRASFAPGGEVV